MEPRARSGSIRQGRLNSSEKVNCDCDGQRTKRNFSVGSCKVESMTVTYKLSKFIGEPLADGNYKWEAPAGAETDCLPPDFTLWLKIENADSYGYVQISPTVPDAGKSSFSGGPGSPNWDKFICGFNGRTETGCFDAKSAETLYNAGRVVDFEPSHQ